MQTILFFLLFSLFISQEVTSWSYQSSPAVVRTWCAKAVCASALFITSSSSMVQAVETKPDVNLVDFVQKLESGQFKKVVFNGINPSTATLFYADGSTGLLTQMPIEDPKSPSGVAQLMAKCQHTPSVICQQDVSDALRLTKKKSTYIGKDLNDQLSHSSYPKELAYEK